ncbi:DNA gyrase subunit A [uncultured Phascolarctobacterium sp.]|uniref:DNA gyrase subunit A n=1 Tax=uncultured Phascolarctobacterium sp. TaxID=512296 RepID=UPI0015AB37DD|nr:DNA gyrase subunit A [uncultured Phascolarctobacterium sp.]
MDLETGAGKVLPVYIEEEMQKSYIDYAMSVIVQRALPDVRDGLKPVHRRILYAMQEAGMASNKPYKKSARIVGEVLGKYHPHGDTSVYDAIVRLAQNFSTRYLMVDGHGNFGSVDGDSAAAMRYTEVRMAKVAEVMLEDIEKETVDFVPNYDESLKEPSVLPAKVPALLINGSSGIAVGMATNIPPHNLSEVVDGLVMLIDNQEVELPELMAVIKGPDFPTGATILGTDGIRSAYTTGRGVVKIRAQAEIEPMQKGKHRIVVTELPYQVNKARLIEAIAQLVKDGVIEGITDLRDESDRRGMRVVIELRNDVVPDVILNQLYKHTKLQDSFGIIMLALVDGHPRVLNLKQILVYYLEHQKEVITRRTRYELGKAKDRAHILEGLKIALDNLDAVISTIRSSATADIAKAALVEKFTLSLRQAQAILDMRLQRLTGLERKKIDDEYIDVMETIDWLESVLADEQKVLNIIKEDLLEMKKKFGDARRTVLSLDTSSMDIEDLIAEEDIVITISHQGYIKRQTLDNFRNQKRGGVGKTGGSGKKNDDCAEHLFLSTTHHNILFFTNKGRVYRQKGYEIPEAGRTAKGTAIINLLPIEQGEKITAVIPVKEFKAEQYMFMATDKGTVKKTNLEDFDSARKVGLIAINLDDNEQLIGVELTDGNTEIILATRNGIAIRFDEQDVRPMGRTAHGVRGIQLNYGDVVIAMDSVKNETDEVLTATEQGLGKRTAVGEYRKQIRGGKGVINIKVNDKTGIVVGMKVINPEQEIMMITAAGIIIRIDVEGISQFGRNAQGVKLMTLNDDDKVVSLAAVQQDNTDCGESDGSDDAAIETDAETVVSEEVTAEEVVTTEE